LMGPAWVDGGHVSEKGGGRGGGGAENAAEKKKHRCPLRVPSGKKNPQAFEGTTPVGGTGGKRNERKKPGAVTPQGSRTQTKVGGLG